MRCIIIAGSPDYSLELIKNTVKHDDFIICADKGYKYAIDADIAPDLIVGDFDSYNDKIAADCEIIRLQVHKNDTDTMHCAEVALQRGYKNFVILCAVGGRTDHSFANFAVLEYIAKNGGKAMLLTQNEQILYLGKGEHSFCGYKNKTFSLFPFGCEKVCVSYVGAEYPLNEYLLESCVTRGVSNIFSSDNAVVQIHNGNAIIVINLSDFNL